MFKNAEPLKSGSQTSSGRDSQGIVPFQFISGVEIKAESVCICFIDDCMDCDVPLAELTFSRECLVLTCIKCLSVLGVFSTMLLFVRTCQISTDSVLVVVVGDFGGSFFFISVWFKFWF